MIQPILPSQIVKYLDSQYPQAKKQLEEKGEQFYLEKDHAPALQYIFTMVESIPPDLLTLDSESKAEFGEAISAIKIAIETWKLGDKLYKLKKLTGRHKMHPLTILRKHLIQFKESDILHENEGATQVPLTDEQVHKLYGVIRSEFSKLPIQTIRSISAIAGIDVTKITSKSEMKSGIGSRAEVLPQVDKLFGEMDIGSKITALELITEYTIKDHPDIKGDIKAIFKKHGFQYINGQFAQIKKIESSGRITTIDKQNKKDRNREMVDIAENIPNPRKVFVVHGRDMHLRDDFFSFLRALGLDPIEWSEALKLTKKATPYIGETLERAFKNAQAVIVLLSPDDEVRLSPNLWKDKEDEDEKIIRLQARPNVLFEAGMAFGTNPDRTLFIEVGEVKKFSDMAGLHVVRLSNTPDRRNEIAERLRTAGCNVSKSGNDWLKAGDFTVAREKKNETIIDSQTDLADGDIMASKENSEIIRQLDMEIASRIAYFDELVDQEKPKTFSEYHKFLSLLREDTPASRVFECFRGRTTTSMMFELSKRVRNKEKEPINSAFEALKIIVRYNPHSKVQIEDLIGMLDKIKLSRWK